MLNVHVIQTAGKVHSNDANHVVWAAAQARRHFWTPRVNIVEKRSLAVADAICHA